jgi:predicted secreted protein
MAASRTIGTSLVKTNGTPKTIADLTSIGAFGIESGEIDVTTLDSSSSYKEFIAGFKDAGEIALKGYVKSPDNFEDMLGYAEAQTIHSWRIQFPSGAKWDFQGFIKSWKQAESTVDGVEGFEGSLRITGKPTYTVSGGVSA